MDGLHALCLLVSITLEVVLILHFAMYASILDCSNDLIYLSCLPGRCIISENWCQIVHIWERQFGVMKFQVKIETVQVKVQGVQECNVGLMDTWLIYWGDGYRAYWWQWPPYFILQCFDAVGLVIWPVKIVPDMTYNVLSVKHCSISQSIFQSVSKPTLHGTIIKTTELYAVC